MRKNFFYHDIIFQRHNLSDTVVMAGEITNKTGQDYNAVVFRITTFLRSKPLSCTKMTINGFCNGQTKKFEKQITQILYKNVQQITHWTIDVETAY